MRILMVAPLPFFQSRGAPFQVYHRAKALGKLGHQIDLVTYAVGEDVDLPNVQIHRALPVPFVRQVKVGPSLAKFPLDTLLFLKTVEMLLRRRYDCIHTHLEAGFFGAVLSRPFRLPHVYDMHDDLAETLASSKFTKNKALIGIMRWVVKTTLRSARVIIIVYPELQNTVDALAPGKPTVMIHNTAVTADDAVDASEQAYNTAELLALRRSLGVPERAPLLLYTGTFEPYQGLGELVRSMPAVLADYPDAHYLLVGGLPHQIAEIADLARSLGVEQSLHLPGRRSHEEMPKFMAMADILLSPRSEGTNTPLKLFSYLDAGKAILASNIHSNTQILTPDVALLVDPTSAALAEGAKTLLGDPALCERLARNAQALAEQQFSYDTFITRTSEAYHLLAPQVSAV